MRGRGFLYPVRLLSDAIRGATGVSRECAQFPALGAPLITVCRPDPGTRQDPGHRAHL